MLISWKTTINLFISLILFGYFSACKQAPSENLSLDDKSKIVAVKGGTMFSMCSRDCNQEVEITSQKISYLLASNEKKYPNKTQEGKISELEWKNLLDLVDVSSFKDLPDVVGCPDCTDGGAEWIEIRFKDGTVKRTTFNFLTPPKPIKPLAERLADYRTEYVELVKKQFPKEKFQDRAQSNKEFQRRRGQLNSY